ncbi:MAG: hypothetical protein ACRCX8_04210 [Sarcina sp.]
MTNKEKLDVINSKNIIEMYTTGDNHLLSLYYKEALLSSIQIETPIVILEDKYGNIVTSINLDDYDFFVFKKFIQLRIRENMDNE